MSPEGLGRVVTRGLGLVLVGNALAGAYELLIRPDPFAAVSTLPKEFDGLRALLMALQSHVDAWMLGDWVLRAVMLLLGGYCILGGSIVVKLLCRSLPVESAD